MSREALEDAAFVLGVERERAKAAFIVPGAAEWLFYYEMWHVTGE